MKVNDDGDVIVYVVVTNPGGVDGRDPTDKGGVVRFASELKAEAEKKKNEWSKVEPRVINFDEAQAKALAKLDPLDRLVMGLT
jgi:hypothetical protein